jgi:hypothetical protein
MSKSRLIATVAMRNARSPRALLSEPRSGRIRQTRADQCPAQREGTTSLRPSGTANALFHCGTTASRARNSPVP